MSTKRLLLIGLVLTTISTSGCSLFRPARYTLSEQVDSTFDGPTYVLIVRKQDGKPVRREMRWEEGLTLNSVIANSGLGKRFSNMDVMIKRPTPQANRMIPLESKYDRVKKRIETAFDYAVYENDYIIVKDSSKGMIEEVIDTAVGVFR